MNTEWIIIMKYCCLNISFIIIKFYQKSDIELCFFVKRREKEYKKRTSQEIGDMIFYDLL